MMPRLPRGWNTLLLGGTILLLLLVSAIIAGWRLGELFIRVDLDIDAVTHKLAPASRLILVPLQSLNLPPELWLLALRSLSLLCYLAGTVALWSALTQLLPPAPRHRVEPQLALLLLWWTPFYDCLATIEPELPVFLLTALALAWLRRRPLLAGTAMGIATAMQVYPAFLLLYWLLARQGRGAAGMVLGLAGTTALSLAVFGWEPHHNYLAVVLPELLAEPPRLLLAGIAVVTWKLRDPPAAEHPLLFCWLVAGLLVFLPGERVSYQILLLLPLLATLAEATRQQRPLLALVARLGVLPLLLDRTWLDQFLAIAARQVSAAELEAFLQTTPGSDPVLHFLPGVWVAYRLLDARLLVPLWLFALLAVLIFTARSPERQTPAKSL